MTFILSLKLHNFRCYGQAALQELQDGLVVLHGPNGAGKTNVLEALSLLSPGRGLRGAKAIELQKNTSPLGGEAGEHHEPGEGGISELCPPHPNPLPGGERGQEAWAVSAKLETKLNTVQLGTGFDPQTEKRIVRINSQNARGQNALGEYLACVWLTPQMDRLFLDSSRERRRFLDRLVFAFDPGHSGRMTRYDNAMGQRSKLLREGKGEAAWLESLEAQMAETGVAIAAARLDFTGRLQSACDKFESDMFPQARLSVRGTLEELLQNVPALEVEAMFKYQLSESRMRDMETGGAATGPHKTDLHVSYAAKSMPADQCSTGEQKALLIGMVLAHARLIAAERGTPPLLLLDEVAAHLDEKHRAALYDLLAALGGQVWLTGTDENLFTAIKSTAQFFEVRDALIQALRTISVAV